MCRVSSYTLAVLALWAGSSRAQYIGPGSTPQGDYLRGVGVATFGMGVYTRATAEANAIDVNTTILWNEYVAAVIRQDNLEKAEHRALVLEERLKNYKAILERIKENPEDRDVMNGDALNARLDSLNDPKIHESSFRLGRVPLPVDVVRRIPFRFDEQGGQFSMQRLSARGKRWPIALRTEDFAVERKEYERAIDHALEQQVEGKIRPEAIVAVEKAVAALEGKRHLVNRAAADILSVEARDFLRELGRVPNLLKSRSIELAIGDLERYSGTTVNDLREFMHSHKLRFGGARTVEERTLYPELYAALKQQLEIVNGKAGGDAR
jgi:hypothetical protein